MCYYSGQHLSFRSIWILLVHFRSWNLSRIRIDALVHVHTLHMHVHTLHMHVHTLHMHIHTLHILAYLCIFYASWKSSSSSSHDTLPVTHLHNAPKSLQFNLYRQFPLDYGVLGDVKSCITYSLTYWMARDVFLYVILFYLKMPDRDGRKQVFYKHSWYLIEGLLL